jgi:hypothetical protein
MGVVDAAERYADHVEAKGGTRSTVTDYRGAVRVHFKPYFGDRPLDAVKPTEIEEFIRLKR